MKRPALGGIQTRLFINYNKESGARKNTNSFELDLGPDLELVEDWKIERLEYICHDPQATSSMSSYKSRKTYNSGMDEKSVLSNRQKSKRPRGRSFWCGCDSAMVWAGQKCPKCGKRNAKKRDRP